MHPSCTHTKGGGLKGVLFVNLDRNSLSSNETLIHTDFGVCEFG